MDFNTTYNTEFTPKSIKTVKAVKPSRNDNEYRASNAPFDAISTYKCDYIPHEGEPAQSFKPDGNAYSFNGSAKLEPCSATLLKTNIRSGYAYSVEKEKGHKFCTPKSILAQ
jgi:hypothetical protein